MDKLFKKLEEMSTLLKQFNASIKLPKLSTSIPKPPKQPKIPGIAPGSKKDPVKVAQQLKNAELTPKVSFGKSGQWSLNKEEEQLYHIHVRGQRITDKPMKMGDLTSKHGAVQNIESQPGYTVVPVKVK